MRKLRWICGSIAVAGLAAAALYDVSCVDNGNVDTTCPVYCQNIGTVCEGGTAQYSNNDTCLRICAAMEAGTQGLQGVDTVGCRSAQVSAAKDELTAAAQYNDCVNGGVSTGAGGAQVCGGDAGGCGSFCALALALCGSMTGYTDLNDCITTCGSWGQTFSGQLIGSTGNTLECRTYHLELSQTGQQSDLTTHCPHTGRVSARCFDVADAGSDAATDAAGD